MSHSHILAKQPMPEFLTPIHPILQRYLKHSTSFIPNLISEKRAKIYPIYNMDTASIIKSFMKKPCLLMENEYDSLVAWHKEVMKKRPLISIPFDKYKIFYDFKEYDPIISLITKIPQINNYIYLHEIKIFKIEKDGARLEVKYEDLGQFKIKLSDEKLSGKIEIEGGYSILCTMQNDQNEILIPYSLNKKHDQVGPFFKFGIISFREIEAHNSTIEYQ